jgi:hypothetical protein
VVRRGCEQGALHFISYSEEVVTQAGHRNVVSISQWEVLAGKITEPLKGGRKREIGCRREVSTAVVNIRLNVEPMRDLAVESEAIDGWWL